MSIYGRADVRFLLYTLTTLFPSLRADGDILEYVDLLYILLTDLIVSGPTYLLRLHHWSRVSIQLQYPLWALKTSQYHVLLFLEVAFGI